MTNTEVVEKKTESAPSEKTEHPGYEGQSYLPKTDIIETVDGVTIWAEMPGVGNDAVDIVLEKNVLTIEGRIQEPAIPEGYGPKGHEYPLGHYYRTFKLSNEFDRDTIQAQMKNGVLSVTLPRHKEVAPKRIEVTQG